MISEFDNKVCDNGIFFIYGNILTNFITLYILFEFSIKNCLFVSLFADFLSHLGKTIVINIKVIKTMYLFSKNMLTIIF